MDGEQHVYDVRLEMQGALLVASRGTGCFVLKMFLPMVLQLALGISNGVVNCAEEPRNTISFICDGLTYVLVIKCT